MYEFESPHAGERLITLETSTILVELEERLYGLEYFEYDLPELMSILVEAISINPNHTPDGREDYLTRYISAYCTVADTEHSVMCVMLTFVRKVEARLWLLGLAKGSEVVRFVGLSGKDIMVGVSG
jgi:hypothetical protein